MRALTSRRVAAFGALGTIIMSGLASCSSEEKTEKTASTTTTHYDSTWRNENIYGYVPPDPTEATYRGTYNQEQMVDQTPRTTQDSSATSSSSPGEGVFFYPTGKADTSILRLRFSGPKQVQLGQPYAYNLEITNLTKAPVGEVVVRNVFARSGSNLEDGQSALGYAPPETKRTTTSSTDPAKKEPSDDSRSTTGTSGGASADTSVARSTRQSQTPTTGKNAPDRPTMMKSEWEVGHLKPGETKTLKVEGTAEEVGTINYCMTVSCSPLACTALEVINSQLQLSAKAPKQAMICDEVEYTYVIRNAGTGAANNVRVMVSLPPGVSSRDGRHEVNLPVGSIPPGETREVKARFKPTERGELTTTAVAQSELGASDEFEFTTLIQEPALQVKVNGPQWIYPGGQPIPFEVVVTNTGDVAAEDTILDFNARGMTADFSERKLGRIEPGESKRVSIPLGFERHSTAPGAVQDPGEIPINASVRARCVESVSASAKTRLRTMPALLLETVDLTDPVAIGQTTTYQIAVKNQGTGAAKNVRLTATLPQGLEFVNGSGDSRVSASGKNLNFEAIGSLNPGATAKWTVTAKALSPGMMQFELKLMSDDLEQAAIESEPTRLFDPNAPMPGETRDQDVPDSRP